MKHWKTSIILKNQLNHQLNIVILKKFAYYEMFFFFLRKFLSRQFFILVNVFYNYILILLVLVMKWNITSSIEYFFPKILVFSSFLNISLDKDILFLAHVE